MVNEYRAASSPRGVGQAERRLPSDVDHLVAPALARHLSDRPHATDGRSCRCVNLKPFPACRLARPTQARLTTPTAAYAARLALPNASGRQGEP